MEDISNANNNNQNIKVSPTQEDIDLAANAVLSNPDTDTFGLPPDQFRGLGTTTAQRITQQIKLDNFGQPTDVYVVQWPFEPVGTSGNSVGIFVAGMADESSQGVVTPAPSLVGWDPAFAGTITMGGLCVYIMEAGKSPFPGPNGPYLPLAVEQLRFGEDMLHDSARAIGGFYEVINTTADVFKQGTSYHASLENPTNEVASLTYVSTNGGNPAVATFVCDQELMPFGSTTEMTKVRNNATLAAREGVFAPSRLTVLDNAPTRGINYSAIYVGGNQAGTLTLTGGRRFGILYGNGAVLTHTVAGAVTSYFQNGANTGKAYKTNMSLQMSVFQGLNTQGSLTLVRRLVSHCLCTTGSDYYSFASYGSVPPDSSVMDALAKAVDLTPDFYPSSSNKNGKAWKLMKGVFNKGLKAAKPFVKVGKQMAMQSAMTAVPQLRMLQSPTVANVAGLSGSVAKALRKRKTLRAATKNKVLQTKTK
jgi:hypothetical protein